MNVILGDMITTGLLLVVIEKMGEGLVILMNVAARLFKGGIV